MKLRSIPVIIGLAGSGKSSVIRLLSECTGLSIFESDTYFRACRALSVNSTDPRRRIMDHFLNRIEQYFPQNLIEVRADAERVDSEGRCPFYNGKYFRTRHGEKIFRAYETEMLKWAFSNGMLNNSILDLSASAPLYEENRVLFSKLNGYVPLLLNTPAELICRNILSDYALVQTERAAGNVEATIRGAYEILFDDVLNKIKTNDEFARQNCLKETATFIIAREIKYRMPIYLDYSLYAVTPRFDNNVQEIAESILDCLKLHEC